MPILTSSTTATDHIAKTTAQRVEVLASPGSGKTYTLLRRIEHLIAHGVPARRILVLSFSTASVGELRRHLGELCTANAQPQNPSTTGKTRTAAKVADLSAITVQTAHAFALGLLRKRLPGLSVLSDRGALALLAKAVQRAAQDCNAGKLWIKPSISKSTRKHRLELLQQLAEPATVKLLLRLFTLAHTAQTPVSTTVQTQAFSQLQPHADVLRAVDRRYRAFKSRSASIDYGDMLTQAIDLIHQRPAAVPYTHILVDEYQDCSAAQTQLLAAIANLPRRQIMVFGDPHQAVFGFAGSSYTPLAQVLADVRNLSLPVSRRLTVPVATLASAVAEHGPDNSIVAKRQGPKPKLLVDSGLNDQIRRAVGDIQRLTHGGAAPHQIAVLARTRAQLGPVEQTLLAAGIQTQRLGTVRHIQHSLRVLRLVKLVERLARTGAAISAEAVRAASPRFKSEPKVDESMWQREARALVKAARVPSLDGRYRLCAAAYLRLLGGVRTNADVRADVNRWEPACRPYARARDMATAIRAMQPSAVVTATIHAAKGREWDHVLVMGVTDGLLPLYLSRDQEALAEERRLLYVAITRACKTLRLYHAPANHARSRQRFEQLSRFIETPLSLGLLERPGKKLISKASRPEPNSGAANSRLVPP
jgi:DNA helicase-2/ATP-dependent DNA helicase PcrA